MNKIVNFLFLCFCVIFNYGICIASTMNDEVYDLQKVSEWITDNVCFPEDAYKYRVAGIEQFCISTSWDGKVFISSGLSTLNPAFEEEIKKVVESTCFPQLIFFLLRSPKTVSMFGIFRVHIARKHSGQQKAIRFK